MPPVLVAFFLLLGGLTAPDLVKGLDPRSDRSSRPKLGKPAPVEYRTWTSSPTIDRRTGKCTFTVFALGTREKLTRLRLNGEEKLLDWSWSWEAPVPAMTHASGMYVEFIDPVTREVKATHEITETCWGLPKGDVR